MKRRVIILTVLCILFCISIPIHAGESIESKVVDREVATTIHYSFPGVGNEELPVNPNNNKSSLGSTRKISGVGHHVGSTWYEYQRNGSMGRMITHAYDPNTFTNYIYFSWMYLSSASGGDRRYNYSLYNFDTDDMPYHNGVSITAPGEWAGYVGVDAANDGRAIIGGHNDEGDFTDPHFYWELFTGSAFFPYNDQVPRSIQEFTGGTTYSGQEVIWPRFRFVENATDTVLHVIACTNPYANYQPLYYFARRGSGDNLSATWDNPPKIIDSVYTFGHDLFATDDGKVALCWIANIPCTGDDDTASGFECHTYFQEYNDVYYQISNDNGINWQPRVNITNKRYEVDIVDTYLPYTDLSCLLDLSGNLHVTWNAKFWPYTTTPEDNNGNRQSMIYHWSEFTGAINKVHGTNWEPENCNGGNWALTTAKMSIAECNGKFYIVFTQFNDDDCASASNPGYPNGASNGELYVVVSNDGGNSWDDARNLTNSTSPDCDWSMGASGPCASENWASVTPYGTNLSTMYTTTVIPQGGTDNGWYLDVQYIDDPSAGTPLFGEGYTDEASLKWFRFACVEPRMSSISLESISGAGTWIDGTETKIKPGVPVDITLRYTNNTGENWIMVLNDYKVYLSTTEDGLNIDPSGTFSPPAIDTNFTNAAWGSLFNNYISYQHVHLDGTNTDTIGVIALGTGVGAGLPDGYDEPCFKFTTYSALDEAGKYLCVDSSFVPPGASWQWWNPVPDSVLPKWDGPHCWLIEDESCCGLRGDVAEEKSDGLVLVNDLVWLVDYLFKGGEAPECLIEGDCAVPLDEQILVNDLVWLVDYLFKGGEAPPGC